MQEANRPDSPSSVAQLQQLFSQYRRNLGYSRATVRTHAYILNAFQRYLDCHHGVRCVYRLHTVHVQAYLSHACALTNAKGMPLTPGSVNNRIGCVRTFLAFLYQRGYLTKDLAQHLPYVKTPTLLPTSVLEHHQVRRLLNRIDITTPPGIRDRTILELLYTCAIRSAELIGLTLDDLHLPRATATVTGKGNKQRVVPIGRTALRFLQSYLNAIRPFWPGAAGCRSVFLNLHGRPLATHTLRRIVARHTAELDTTVTPHTFRRSCTTELVRSNANLYHVKELLGHESLETLTPYTKLTINDLRKTHAKCHPRERDQ